MMVQAWAIGGWDPYSRGRMEREGIDTKALKTVEIFDAKHNQWVKGPSMVTRRAFHKATVLNNDLYVRDAQAKNQNALP